MRMLADIIRKFNTVLTKHQKVRIGELIIIMLIGGLFETLSVTVILPFMQVVMKPEEVMNRSYVKVICDVFGIHSDRTFLVFLSLMIALMYLLKNVYLIAEYNVQYRFVFNNRFMLQQRVLHNIIHRPYQYFLNTGSAEIMRLVGGDTDAAFDILINLLNLATELVVSAMLIFTILIMSPVITLCIAAVLLILVILIYRIARPMQTETGKEAQRAETGRGKWLLQAIQGIKEIKVVSNEKFFEDKYEYYGRIANEARRKSQILSLSPKYFIEAFSMASMFIAVAVMLYMGTEFASIVPTLTVVAMAAIRILPSANRISFTMSNISFQKPRFDTFIENINNLDDDSEYKSAAEYTGPAVPIPVIRQSIEFRDISFAYSEKSGYILENADMTVRRGESIGIVGGSGAGKTTAVDIILGLLIPQSGAVLIDGNDIRGDMPGWLSQVGYIPQMIFMLDGSIRENIEFGEPIPGDPAEAEARIWTALREASLDEFVKGLPDGIDTRIGERGVRVSGGQRQRIGIARTLYRNPQVLIFDEATSALDNDTESSIMESIHSLHGQKTMIIIAHRLTTIEACDHIYRVENGKIIQER